MALPDFEQLPLAFGHDARTGRDDLLVSSSSQAAAAIADSWPHWPSPVVILTGPPGSGKSHIADIWTAQSGATALATLDAGAGLAPAGHGPVLVEDVDRRTFADADLFHLINAVRESGHHLLMTARERPSAWKVSLPDLLSRLRAATVVEIGPPDDALLAQVLVKLFADRQLVVDDRLVAYLVGRMERSFAAANALVATLDHQALARGLPVNRRLARLVLEGSVDDGESR